MADSLVFDEASVTALLAGPNGPVAQVIDRVAREVESHAKLNATGKVHADGSRGPRVRTGRLRSSISVRLGQDSEGVYADVGTNVFYGRILELGLTKNGARYPFLLPALETVRRSRGGR